MYLIASSFLRCVQVPTDSKVLLVCQQGLRSKAAAQQLAKAGYNSLAWVEGGLNRSQPGDVPTSDGSDVRYAGIGGVSSMIHWTKLQQENAGPLGGWKSVMAVVCTPGSPVRSVEAANESIFTCKTRIAAGAMMWWVCRLSFSGSSTW